MKIKVQNIMKIAAVAACVMMVGCGHRTTPTERYTNDYLLSTEGVLSVESSDSGGYKVAGRYVMAKSNGEWEIVKDWDEAVEVAKTDSAEYAHRGEIAIS